MKGVLKITIFFSLLLLAGCTSLPEYSQLENGDKQMTSKSEFNKWSFNYDDFFVKDIRNSYIPNFNEQIFTYMQGNCDYWANMKFAGYGYEKKPSYKECVTLSKINDGALEGNSSTYKISYTKRTKYGLETYYFKLIVDTDPSREKAFNDQLNYIRELERQKGQLNSEIEGYEWTIQNCAAPTIEKSRVVTVPKEVTKRRYHEPIIHFGSYEGSGTQVIQEGYWEEYTVTEYVKETQYYTEPNPNYNPQAVSNAKKMLPVQKQKLTEVSQAFNTAKGKLRELVPYKIYKLNFEQ